MNEFMENVLVECCVYVRYDKKPVLTLGMGMNSVLRFSKLTDEGIQGSLHVEKGWYCNREVTMTGDLLLKFIEKEYTETYSKALAVIIPELVYIIVANDLS